MSTRRRATLTMTDKQTPLVYLPTLSLNIHSDLLGLPEWPDDSTEFEALCADIAERGIDDPIKVTPKKLIVDGRHRWRAAKKVRLDQVPAIQVPEDQSLNIILNSLIQRRHYSRGALAYMLVPVVRARQQTTSESLEVIIARYTFSISLFKQAARVRDIFEEAPEYKALMEPGILAGDTHLGAVIAGYAGRQATIGKSKQNPKALQLWERSFTDLRKRLSAWEKFSDAEKATAATQLHTLVEAMPADLLWQFSRKLAAEAKRRKENE